MPSSTRDKPIIIFFSDFRYFNSWIESEDIKFAGDTSLNETESDIEPGNHFKPDIHNRANEPVKKENKKDLEELLMENDIKESVIAPETSSGSWCELSEDIKRYFINL